MKRLTPSPVIALAVIGTQLLGPAVLWAADQRGVRIEANRRAVVSGLTGGELTATTAQRTTPVQFSEAVGFGDALRTGVGTIAEVLVNHQAVVTILGESQVRLEQEGANTIVHLTKGDVLLSVAASRLGEGQAVILETPTARVRTTGGVLRARVGAAPRQAGPVAPPLDARPHLVSFSPAMPVATGSVGAESFEVLEGTMLVVASTPGAKSLTVPAGQGIQSAGGLLGAPTPLTSGSGSPTPVLGVAQHGSTPASGLEFVAQQQMTQVGALRQALFGNADANEEGGEKTGEKNAAQGAIVATLFGTSAGGSLTNSLFGSGSPYAAALLNATNAQGTGVGDDRSDAGQINLQSGSIIVKDVRGGPGLLLFANRPEFRPTPTGSLILPEKKSTFTTAIELLRVDGGNLFNASHAGIAPQNTLIVRGVTENRGLSISFNTGAYFGTNGQSKGSEVISLDGPVAITGQSQNFRLDGAVGINGEVPAKYYQQVVGATSLTSQSLTGLSLFSNQLDGAYGFAPDVRQGGPGVLNSNIDGAITARSATSGDRLVTLTGGVVLDNGTQVGLGTTTSTSNYFQFKSGLSAQDRNFSGALLSVLASQEGGFNPAFVQIQDRVLGVLNESAITGSGDVALLAVLDSRLIGPTAPSTSLVNGVAISNRIPSEISPLLELDSFGNQNPSRVTVKSAVVIRYTDAPFPAALDGALLEASSPILAISNGMMTTTGHFADFSTNGKVALNATVVPGDALVRLNQGSLTVGGNLFNLNNAKASVTGQLFSLTNSSSLTINGVLISLKGNSLFTLTSNSLGSFGAGNNQLTVNNNLCATAGCKTVGGLFKVAGGGTVELPANGFTAFGTSDGKALNPNGTDRLNIGTDAALFFVETNSTLKIVKR